MQFNYIREENSKKEKDLDISFASEETMAASTTDKSVVDLTTEDKLEDFEDTIELIKQLKHVMPLPKSEKPERTQMAEIDNGFGKVKICKDRYFGVCKRKARDCWFSHDPELLNAYHEKRLNMRLRNGICRYHFGNGSCRDDRRCKYSHDPHYLAFLKESNGDCKDFARGECPRGFACVFKHDPTKKIVLRCKYFDNGYCMHGANCKYAHVLPTASVNQNTTAKVVYDQMIKSFMGLEGKF